jgi:hypothetical protein
MKKIYLILVVFITSSSFVLGQSNDKQSVLQTLYEMAAALKSNNADALDKLYTNDYTSVSPRG